MADTLPSALPAQLVKDFHGAFGDHHARAVHAKGTILEGSLQIPMHRGHLLRFDRGQATDLMAATIPI
jgi:hypothetical protein